MESLTAHFRLEAEGKMVLLAPRLGVFSPSVLADDLVRPLGRLGVLRVLERRYQVLAPAGAMGVVEPLSAALLSPVGYGDPILVVHPIAGQGAGVSLLPGPQRASKAAQELVVRAPIHGIFYRRPSPVAPNYVEVGSILRLGQTIGLVEVMKTFNPVVYEGEGLPVSARVIAIRAEDRTEVEAHAPLLAVEPAPAE